MKMKKFLALLLAGTMALSVVACGDSAQSGSSKEESSATKEEGKEGDSESTADTADGLSVCLASEPASLDPALNSAVDGATMILHLFSGLTKWEKSGDGLEVVLDGATDEEKTENADGTVTYTYTLRDDMKWSDGEPVTAEDFVFGWNRAAGPELSADYNYMFDVVDGYEAMWESEDSSELDEDGNPIPTFVNPDAKLNVVAKDDKTLEVTLVTDVPYWRELLAFPSYLPVREDVVADESWATDPKTYVCNGPYTMTGWDHNSVITLEKNENYYDADSITMDKINFFLSDDANNMLTNFENGSWQLIDDIPTNEIASLKENYPDEFQVEGQIGTYYVCWNINEDILPADSGLSGTEAEAARAEIRNAVALLFDRNYIVDEIAQGGQVPASSFVAMGITDADSSEQFYENANKAAGNKFLGYYDTDASALQDNYNKAIDVLKKYYDYDGQKFTNFPGMTYLYNTSEGHKAIGEYLQSALAAIGITMQLENQEWNTFLETRKNGDYSIARNGWLADYNDPISFLDMWTTGSGNNDVQFGKGANAQVAAYSIDLTDIDGYDLKVENGTWAQTYDEVMKAIKLESDKDKRYALMHKAEDLLMSTGCICPLYYYTDLFMIDSSVDGFFSNPLGYKYFMYTTME